MIPLVRHRRVWGYWSRRGEVLPFCRWVPIVARNGNPVVRAHVAEGTPGNPLRHRLGVGVVFPRLGLYAARTVRHMKHWGYFGKFGKIELETRQQQPIL